MSEAPVKTACRRERLRRGEVHLPAKESPLERQRHRHASAVGTLPMLHQDPFDRMLVAQVLTEPHVLVTHDGKSCVTVIIFFKRKRTPWKIALKLSI
jgi:hypothetical protein